MSRRRPTRLGALTVGVVAAGLLVLGGCASTDPEAPGTAASPSASATAPGHDHHHGGGHGTGSGGGTHHGSHAHAVTGDGRQAYGAGYRLAGLRLTGDRVTFRVAKESGGVETQFASTHSKKLHMFVFATDLAEFRHVHPVMDEDGRWALDLPGLAQGEHRVAVEFRPKLNRVGTVMLGANIDTGGEREKRPLPPPGNPVVVDGYTVRLDPADTGDGPTGLDIAITGPDGGPATLRPYLGSWAHAALVHGGTLALTHLHPQQGYAPGTTSPDRLTVDLPASEPGAHRLIVEFATSTGLHQAEFTVSITY